MKLNKIMRKSVLSTMAVFVAAAMSFTGCSNGDGSSSSGPNADFSSFQDWSSGKCYTISPAGNSATISHSRKADMDGSVGMTVSLGDNDTLVLKIRNNGTEEAYAKCALKNNVYSAANGYKPGLKSAKVDGTALADVEWGAMAKIAAGEEATVELVYNTSLPTCDTFQVSLNSEGTEDNPRQLKDNMPATGNITVKDFEFKKSSSGNGSGSLTKADLNLSSIIAGIQKGSDVWGSKTSITGDGPYTVTSGNGWSSQSFQASIPVCFNAGDLSTYDYIVLEMDISSYPLAAESAGYPTIELKASWNKPRTNDEGKEIDANGKTQEEVGEEWTVATDEIAEKMSATSYYENGIAIIPLSTEIKNGAAKWTQIMFTIRSSAAEAKTLTLNDISKATKK